MTASPEPSAILVVDDDVGLVRLIERSLKRDGHFVATATSGREAIAWLTTHQASLILLDLKLKDMGGSEVITQLEANGKGAPFIVITGQGDERVAVEMMKRGALDYLVKDVNFIEAVPAVVRRAVVHLDQERRLAIAEEATRASQDLTHAVLNSLPARIVVVNREGVIVATNEPWDRFGSGDHGSSISRGSLGDNYLEICRSAANAGEQEAEQILVTANAALGLQKQGSSVEYRCRLAGRDSWFSMSATPLAGSAGGAVLAHTDITERKRLEAEVLQIAETERQRVAADLHDGICQELTGIGFGAAALQRQLARKRNPLAARIKELEQAITDAVGHTRQVARGLNAVVADGLGLMHALSQLAITTAQMHRLQCVFECSTPVSISDPITANELYRIAQEALNNAVRHAQATQVSMELSEKDDCILLTVQDDGKGLPSDVSGAPGMGLRVMKYRAGLIRGALTIRRRRPTGTSVICTVQKAHRTNERPGDSATSED